MPRPAGACRTFRKLYVFVVKCFLDHLYSARDFLLVENLPPIVFSATSASCIAAYFVALWSGHDQFIYVHACAPTDASPSISSMPALDRLDVGSRRASCSHRFFQILAWAPVSVSRLDPPRDPSDNLSVGSCFDASSCHSLVEAANHLFLYNVPTAHATPAGIWTARRSNIDAGVVRRMI